jgi:hypothetical protein
MSVSLIGGGDDDNPISEIIDGASDVDDSMPENTVFDTDGDLITLDENEDSISQK